MASWIIPCNPNHFDVFGAFRALKTVDWRQTVRKIEIGDTVYIYTGRPIQAITHKCVVLDIDIPYEAVDSSDDKFILDADDQRDSLQPYWRYMRLQLEKEYDPSLLSYAKLVEHGLKGSIQGQRRTGSYIQAAIDIIDNEKA